MSWYFEAHLEPLLHAITATAENLTNFILAFILMLSQMFLRKGDTFKVIILSSQDLKV